MTTDNTRTRSREWIARILTEAFAPSVVIVLLSLALAFEATDRHLGQTVLWGMVVSFFSAALPMWFIVRGARAGKWDSHHIRDREGRTVPLLVCFASTAVGLTILLIGNAPKAMVAQALTMLAVLVVTGAVTVRWKISMHAAVSAGGVAMLAALYGVWALALFVLVVLIGWSRVVVRDHTVAQVVAGSVVGPLVAAAVFLPLR